MKQVVLSSSSKKRLISELMSSRTNAPTDGSFTLKGSSEFTSRSSDVFAGLETLERAHKTRISEDKELDSIANETESSSKIKSVITFGEKESPKSSHKISNSTEKNSDSYVFKKPLSTNIIRKKNNDWRARKKWTKYSLANVPLSSNATNSSVALAFISDLRKSREAMQEDHKEGDKILFAKPAPKEKIIQKEIPEEVSSSSLKEDEKVLCTNENSKNCVKLHHLEDETD